MRHPGPGERSRLEETFLACCLSGFGLSLLAIRALRNPASRVSRWLDRQVDAAVRLPREDVTR